VNKFIEKEVSFERYEIEILRLDNGGSCEVCIPKKANHRLIYTNEHCEFTPVGWVMTEFGWMPLGYKVVTTELKSLGLRNNPTPMEFPVAEWVFEEKDLQCGDKDFGGIWTAQREGSIKTLKKHCWSTWEMETRGFLTAIYNPVFSNSYRIKSQGVMLLKEIF
jgi:hypothetical protein